MYPIADRPVPFAPLVRVPLWKRGGSPKDRWGILTNCWRLVLDWCYDYIVFGWGEVTPMSRGFIAVGTGG